jgi:hypothetical protein
MLNSTLPVRVAALGPGAPVSQDSFARRTRIVMQNTARWDGIQPCALARGSYRCAPTLPSSAHEEWRPSVLVALRTPDVDEKKLRNEPNHGAGILVIPEIEGQRNPANSLAGWTRSTPPRQCPSPVPSLLRRRAHRFPRSHGPAKSSVSAPWLRLRCCPPARAMNGMSTPGDPPSLETPKEPESRRNPGELGSR